MGENVEIKNTIIELINMFNANTNTLYDSESIVTEIANYLKGNSSDFNTFNNLPKETLIAILKLYVYEMAYLYVIYFETLNLSLSHYRIIEKYIEKLTLREKIDNPIESEIIKCYIDMINENNYLVRYKARAYLLANKKINMLLKINPFAIFTFEDNLQGLSIEEETIYQIIQLYIKATTINEQSDKYENPIADWLKFLELAKKEELNIDFFVQYMLCNLYRNYIFNSEFLKNDPSSASEEDYSQFENIEIKDETYDTINLEKYPPLREEELIEKIEEEDILDIVEEALESQTLGAYILNSFCFYNADLTRGLLEEMKLINDETLERINPFY